MAAARMGWKMVDAVRGISVAKMFHGTRVSALGVGNIVSKVVWSLRKEVGPMKVEAGLGPSEKRQSSFDGEGVAMVGVVLLVSPLNKLRALTGVWLSLGSASASIRRSECLSWQNSLGERPAKFLSGVRWEVVLEAKVVLPAARARLRQALAPAMRASSLVRSGMVGGVASVVAGGRGS
jgi:hypothetical protein